MKFIRRWYRKDRQVIRFTVFRLLLWLAAILLFITLIWDWWPTKPEYLYFAPDLPIPVLQYLANFDGIHYLSIAQSGYGLYQQAFFPLYPLVIRLFTPFLAGKVFLAGWFISIFSFLLALFFLYKLISLDFDKRIAERSLFYLLIFPTAFFFTAVYSESLFLFLAVASFYFAKMRNWWLAGVLGAAAAATRFAGIFLLPALLIEWHQSQKFPISNFQFTILIKTLLPLFLIPMGLLLYMRYLEINYHDPLLFFHVQPFFGAERAADKIILLYQVFWRYLKMLITVDKFTATYFVVVLEAASGILFLFLSIFAFLKRWYPYAVFMIFSYMAPTLTGTFSSLPRYALCLFPGFILLGLWGEKYRPVRILYPLICLPVLALSLILFTHGWWIA